MDITPPNQRSSSLRCKGVVSKSWVVFAFFVAEMFSLALSAQVVDLPLAEDYYLAEDAFPASDKTWVDGLIFPESGFEKIIPGRVKIKFAPDFKWNRDAYTLMLRSGVEFDFLRPLHFGFALIDVRFLGSKERPSEDQTEQLAARLLMDRVVTDTAPDAVMNIYAVPDDTRYGEMWHLRSIGAAAGWDVTTGGGQEVCVIDTGTLTQHEDLINVVEDGYDFISAPSSGGDQDGRDDNEYDEGGQSSYHGSHVAGTILAEANNGKGIPGLNWSAKLVTARALGVTGQGSSTDIADAILWCSGYDVSGVPTRDRPADVINMSLGSHTQCDSYSQQVVTAAEDAGVIVVSATGNNPYASISMPANCNGSLAVAAYGGETNRRKSSYSTFGAGVDVVAPGGDGSGSQTVLSVNGPGNTTYKWLQGTSMATPHTSGVISLMLDLNPNLTRQEIITLFQQTGSASCQSCDGKPILNMEGLLNAIDPVDSGDDEEPEDEEPEDEEEPEEDPEDEGDSEEEEPEDEEPADSDDDDETRSRPELNLGGSPDENVEFRNPVIVDGGDESESVYVPPDGSGQQQEPTNGYVPPTQSPVYNQYGSSCSNSTTSEAPLLALVFGAWFYRSRRRS